MYNKVFKNYQINLGSPYEVKVPLNLNTGRLKKSGNEDNDKRCEELKAKEPEDIKKKAGEEAERIKEEAQHKACQIILNANKEAERIARDAFNEAMKKGYEEGLKKAQEQYEDLLREAETIKEDASAHYIEVLDRVESDVVEVILGIARKVIGIEISASKESILHIAKQALMKCSNKNGMVLKVSPDDYDVLVENKNRLSEMVDGMGEFEIKRDVSLKQGACIVETPYGCVDAGSDTRLKKIEEAFRKEIGKQGFGVD